MTRSAEMSLPRATYDPRRVFLCSFPDMPFVKYRRAIGIYLSGALFALAFAVFFDAALLSANAKPTPDAPYDTVPVHVTFLDWVPGIFATFGLLIVNIINKDMLQDGYGDSRAVWRARLFLFIGFACMAGGLAGSIAVLVIKYLQVEYEPRFVYYGYAGVVQNVALMLSAIVLWLSQHASNEYDYNLTL